MKTKPNPFLRHALATSVAIGISVTSASATTYYWDGGTVDIASVGNAASNPAANGNWNSTVKNWDQAPSGSAHIAWPNSSADTAAFAGTARTVTVSGTVTAGTMLMGSSGYSFTGGTIDTDTFDSNGWTNTTLTSNLTGTINFQATSWTGNLGTTTAATINGDNTGLTSTTVNLNENANHIVLNNAGALGADGADVQITKGVVNLGNTAATSISYNKWDIDLNGGAIRARFGIQTINGPVTVSANSWLMTRDANDSGQDPKLVFSSTATIALGANTLSLHSALRPDNSGIELNGVISGTGGITQAASTLTNAGTATGTVTLNANNTYTGDTLVNNGTLALSSTGGLKFKIGADDVNNKITGAGTVSLDGLFTFDLTNASTIIGDSWNIVNVATLTESYGGNFAISGFTPDGGGDLWNGSANGASYQFSETSGVLTVVPEPNVALLGTLGLLALLRRKRA